MSRGYSSCLIQRTKEDIELKCPLCGKSHMYSMSITRSNTYYYNQEYDKWKDSSFTRLFNCPITGNNFEAHFFLKESRESKVLNISINI